MVKYQCLKGFYEVERTVGCGGFAKVKLATHLATGEKVAIKIMDKALLKDDLPRVKLELKALKSFAHEHICKLYQIIETEAQFFIVMEYCAGGELFDHIVEKNRLSENESRLFFRQIISAVAYLHSLGYAHRDLKPENVLLDHSKNLKLIDFGLCARPEGGMESNLYTSCGSPTYAAPELVRGHKYLGPEVDVWAMGVLLYALMAGFLPFDDPNINTLYKKILDGKYEEPFFMSLSSKRLIRQMLQSDPKKRITINQLIQHPWLNHGIHETLKITGENIKTLDDDILALMAQYHGSSKEHMWRHLKRWRYDYDTATYFILMNRKKRGLPLQILQNSTKLPIRIRSAEELIKLHARKEVLGTVSALKQFSKSDSTPTKLLENAAVSKSTKFCTPTKTADMSVQTASELLSPCKNFVEPRKPSSIRKPLKRLRSPNLDGECSPVPTKKTPGRSTTPKSPERKSTPVANENSSARKVFGSIERSFHKVRNALTPRRTNDNNLGPTVLANKDLCNVSTTQCSDPEFVLLELTKALQKKGINCERKGFTLRGKMEPNSTNGIGGCSFELEICYLPVFVLTPSQRGSTPTTPSRTRTMLQNKSTPVGVGKAVRRKPSEFNVEPVICNNKVGIRRKRLKGNSWCYKKVCEQVLALTATELKHIESSV